MIKEVEDMINRMKEKSKSPMDDMIVSMYESMLSKMSDKQQEQYMFEKRQRDIVDKLKEGGKNE